LEEVLLLLDWDDEAAGTVCLLISLLAVTASASLRRTELELVEELDDEAVAFISLLTELEVEVFREVVPLLLDDVVSAVQCSVICMAKEINVYRDYK